MKNWAGLKFISLFIKGTNYGASIEKLTDISYKDGYWEVTFNYKDGRTVIVIGQGINFSYEEMKEVKGENP